MRDATPPVRDLVLLGGGHSHVQVLKAFGMRPVPGVRLTVVCREVLTPYSGMLPGQVAGRYPWRDIHIDLGPLARFAGARLIADEATGLDLANREVTLHEHPSLRYDLLSVNTGAVPEQAVPCGIPVKPIGRFLPQWQTVQASLRPDAVLGVVGGGAGGVELALAMRAAVPGSVRILLLTDELLPGGSPGLDRRVRRALARRAVELVTGFRVTEADSASVRAVDGRSFAVDHLFWVTRVAAPPWPAAAGLRTDPGGFIEVDRFLRSKSHPDVFAAGDIAALGDQPRPKAGVFAVRAGRVLADNLRRTLFGAPLRPFRAQRRFLALLGTGDGRAIATRGAWTAEGAWVWRWKDSIDRDFMARFRDLPAPGMQPPAGRLARMSHGARPAAIARDIPDVERCGGCGAKLGADPLRRVLARLPDQARAGVPIGIGDDAAVLEVSAGRLLLTVDGFRSMVDDPYRFGRIVAHHSLNDVFAMGGRATAALAMATVPLMAEAMMEQELYWLLRGAVDVLNAHDVPLVGGHSAEGAELSLALTVAGVPGARVLGKGGLAAGDRLILTKPLGTGVLLAGAMRGRAHTDEVEAALAVMDRSNAPALECFVHHGVRALTDVTGFGLLGHLAEMLRASGVGTTLAAGAVPLLAGAQALVETGVTSSLHDNNVRVLRDFELGRASAGGFTPTPTVTPTPLVALLVDPQTAGGLLGGVPADRADACVAALRAAGYPEACVIGVVTATGARIELPVA
ncbi:MAG: selenide, water dikinase SelD [Pseudomonadales bacterium]|nr:selenide, water dikinase SelD [Pseudomonadales bacterium]